MTGFWSRSTTQRSLTVRYWPHAISPCCPRGRCGCFTTGLIFGRNVFQRSHDDSLRLVAQLKEILAKYPS
jgi:hypothetical protein